MGKEDVAAAVERMVKDCDASDRLAAGDFTDLADATLTEAERVLVSAAAREVPDVAGFGIGLGVEASGLTMEYEKSTVIGPRLLEAMEYSGYTVRTKD